MGKKIKRKGRDGRGKLNGREREGEKKEREGKIREERENVIELYTPLLSTECVVGHHSIFAIFKRAQI